jgi:molybdopterin synthase catalytic subunit
MKHVTRVPIDILDLMTAVSSPGRGATACFLGTVRAGSEDGDVVRIAYSGYETMLEEEFGRILGEAGERWPGCAVAAQHRLGDVPLSDASIAVVSAAPHREEAFAACRYIIEEAKRRLPVWKQEMLADGSASWRENDVGATPSKRVELG